MGLKAVIALLVLLIIASLAFYFHYIQIDGNKVVISFPVQITKYEQTDKSEVNVSYFSFSEKNITITVYSNSSNFTYYYTIQPKAENLTIYLYSQKPFFFELLNNTHVIYEEYNEIVNFTLSNLTNPVEIEITKISSPITIHIIYFS